MINQEYTEKLKILFFGKGSQYLTKEELYDKVLSLMTSLEEETKANTKQHTTDYLIKRVEDLIESL